LASEDPAPSPEHQRGKGLVNIVGSFKLVAETDTAPYELPRACQVSGSTTACTEKRVILTALSEIAQLPVASSPIDIALTADTMQPGDSGDGERSVIELGVRFAIPNVTHATYGRLWTTTAASLRERLGELLLQHGLRLRARAVTGYIVTSKLEPGRTADATMSALAPQPPVSVLSPTQSGRKAAEPQQHTSATNSLSSMSASMDLPASPDGPPRHALSAPAESLQEQLEDFSTPAQGTTASAELTEGGRPPTPATIFRKSHMTIWRPPHPRRTK